MNDTQIIRKIYEISTSSLSPDKFEEFNELLIWICKARKIDPTILHPEFKLLEPQKDRILYEGVNLLEDVYRKYSDLNLSFADNWYANVEEYFMHDFCKIKKKASIEETEAALAMVRG